MSDYYISRDTLDSNFNLPITPEQYEDINEALTAQWEALYLEQKYDFVVDNFLEFEETILRCGLEHMILGHARPRAFAADTSLFNRRIMNLLTTYRTYDDSVPQHFNRIFNRDSQIVSAAKSSFSREFDSRIGYWLLPKLRNFVQHQGFPVHGSTYGSTWVSTGKNEKGRNRHTIDIYLTPQELGKGDFNKEQRKRIEKLGPRIDLKFVIRDFMEGFSEAHVTNRDLLEPKLEWAEAYLHSVEDEFLKATGETNLIALAAFNKGEGARRLYLQQRANEERKNLVAKNRKLTKLASRYISNETFDDNPLGGSIGAS